MGDVVALYFEKFIGLATVLFAMTGYGQKHIIMSDFDLRQGMASHLQVKQRLKNALSSVGPEGKVYFLYENADDFALHVQDKRLMPIHVPKESLKIYPWIRDDLVGIHEKGGLLSSQESRHVPLWLKKVSTTTKLGIATLKAVRIDGGNLIRNSKGICLLGVNHRASNEAEVFAALKAHLNCLRVIPIVNELSRFHLNGHLDIAAQFIADNIIVVSEVPIDCDQSDEAVQVTSLELNRIALNIQERVRDQGIHVERIPLAACPVYAKNIDVHQQETITILSYANLVSFNQSILLPHYEEPLTNEVGSLSVSFAKLQAMLQVILSKYGYSKNILPFPVSVEQASQGGSARCLTLDY